MRTALASIAFVAAAVVLVPAQRANAPAGMRVTTSFQCAAPLGPGVKSRRTFCDVVVATAPAGSVAMAIPTHAGAATFRFDLHNRFTVPVVTVPVLAFLRHEAIVSVIAGDGAVLGRAAVVRDYRSPQDLFDQIGGGARPGGVKAVAPGPVESVSFSIPAGVNAVGIVGASLKVLTRNGEEQFDSPGRPVAIVSNLRIDYRPAR